MQLALNGWERDVHDAEVKHDHEGGDQDQREADRVATAITGRGCNG
jgi:hypothetical protein